MSFSDKPAGVYFRKEVGYADPLIGTGFIGNPTILPTLMLPVRIIRSTAPQVVWPLVRGSTRSALP